MFSFSLMIDTMHQLAHYLYHTFTSSLDLLSLHTHTHMHINIHSPLLPHVRAHTHTYTHTHKHKHTCLLSFFLGTSHFLAPSLLLSSFLIWPMALSLSHTLILNRQPAAFSSCKLCFHQHFALSVSFFLPFFFFLPLTRKKTFILASGKTFHTTFLRQLDPN